MPSPCRKALSASLIALMIGRNHVSAAPAAGNVTGGCLFTLPPPDSAWAKSDLSRVAVPKSLWSGYPGSGTGAAAAYNQLCGKTITFTASNGKSATGIIADHMDSDYVGTCERGLWAELKLGEIDDHSGNYTIVF
ncbi:hypothetical protein P389DRAFT_179247 [Cystobasidium minutum MCA 4210]|uniref:uncharacterized protein n=1 Tax=Cystobasidium minutum MCA 4210 TaxID=1397322 RepID=UPI0034CDB3F5|eukprot:jgi/Rhomi1/179247/fgenesh1_pg.3_\